MADAAIRERVRERSARLAIQADPLRGRYVMPAEVDGELGPTPQWRSNNAGATIVEAQTDREVNRPAVRRVCLVEDMRDKGEIPDASWHAWERFERDITRSRGGARVTGLYGERAGGCATPVSQMAMAVLDTIETVDTVRLQAKERAEGALASITPAMRGVLIAIVDEPVTLRQIGQRLGVVDKNAATKVAKFALTESLWLLGQHYQRLYAAASKAP